MALKIDIYGMEVAADLPHWLSRVVRHGPNIDAIRAKHRGKTDQKGRRRDNRRRAALNLLGRRR